MPIYDSDDDISMASSVSFYDNRKRMDADGRSVASTVGMSSHGGDDPDEIKPYKPNAKKQKKKDFLGRDVDENAVAQQEDNAVLMSKIGVVVVLVVFTFIFGIATYSFTRKQQEENFEKAVSINYPTGHMDSTTILRKRFVSHPVVFSHLFMPSLHSSKNLRRRFLIYQRSE